MRPQRRFGLLVERRYLAQSQPAGLGAELVRRGHEVTLIDPEEGCYAPGNASWLATFDLLVCRGRSWPLLSLLGWAEARGARTINRRAAVEAVRNKADMADTLAAGGVPTPLTVIGTAAELARRLPASVYPVVLKPVFGDNSQGLRVVGDAAELARVNGSEPVALAQQFLPSDGFDLKLYVIGREVFGVRKRSPLAGADGAAHPVNVGPELERLALRCGELFGLELYGLDCIETDSGAAVIEVNEFPNYTSVPRAHERLADYVVAAAEARHRQGGER